MLPRSCVLQGCWPHSVQSIGSELLMAPCAYSGPACRQKYAHDCCGGCSQALVRSSTTMCSCCSQYRRLKQHRASVDLRRCASAADKLSRAAHGVRAFRAGCRSRVRCSSSSRSQALSSRMMSDGLPKAQQAGVLQGHRTNAGHSTVLPRG